MAHERPIAAAYSRSDASLRFMQPRPCAGSDAASVGVVGAMTGGALAAAEPWGALEFLRKDVL